MPYAVSTTSEYTVRDQERMSLARNYFDWQARMVTPHLGTRVLEIGCGVGNFTEHLLGREHVIAIDRDESCIGRLRERFENQGDLTVGRMDVGDPSFAELKRLNPDSAVMLNVLEHISDDELALSRVRQVLTASGKLILLVPGFDSLYGPIDANLGHYRRYSKQSIRKLARSQGFHVRVLRYFNSVGFIGWWLNAKIWRRTEQSEAQIRFFDRAVVPVLSRLEGVLNPPFGQSLFAVLEKTDL